MTFVEALDAVFEQIGDESQEASRIDLERFKDLNTLVLALERLWPAEMAEMRQKRRH